MTWLGLVTDVLATHRLTRLVVEDEITADIRDWIWRHHPPQDTKIGYLITCPYCISIWAGALIASSRTPSSGVVSVTVGILRNTLALSGAVSLVHEALERTG